jgi:hypothetical protein
MHKHQAAQTRGLITNPTKKPQQQHPHPTPNAQDKKVPSKKESKPPADTQKPHPMHNTQDKIPSSPPAGASN